MSAARAMRRREGRGTRIVSLSPLIQGILVARGHPEALADKVAEVTAGHLVMLMHSTELHDELAIVDAMFCAFDRFGLDVADQQAIVDFVRRIVKRSRTA